jgi:deoxycytidine triphosphate deaminase
MLNATQILDEGLLLLENTHGKPSQVGYDLSIQSIQKVVSSTKMGFILKDKTILAHYEPLQPTQLDGYNGWILYQGVYDITFHEGCKIPADRTAFIKQRSSLYRNGAIINSPLFDPNFETQHIGTLMYVHETVFIEQDARVAQIYFHECTTVPEDQLYNGQFQFDSQRSR